MLRTDSVSEILTKEVFTLFSSCFFETDKITSLSKLDWNHRHGFWILEIQLKVYRQLASEENNYYKCLP